MDKDQATTPSKPVTKGNRGFASMDPAKQRAIASKGGKSVRPEQRSFSRNHELASAAGRKGGEASHGGGRARQHPEDPSSSSEQQ